ncbi:MAG: hypothetical protein K2L62_05080 [Muribaculaceae bacterium]|nr:hypothetical protein [Muribaculaceae bacterium]MDE6629412.1 hypothetical protein [Muribaculaceae bacterium]
MKKTLYTIALGAALACALGSCKTSEENYRSAYEIAKAKSTEGLTQEEISGFAREEAVPRTVYKGDSIPLRTEYLTREDGGNDGRPMRYNVIAASFRQIFNARSLFTRIHDAGYPSAIILRDRNSHYYVSLMTTASLDSAVSLLRSLQDNPGKAPAPMRSPFPYIMQNASVNN